MAWETGVQSQVESYQRLKKMVLDSSLLNTQHYKVQNKSKVEQSKEKEWHPPLDLGIVTNEKEAFRSPVATFTLLLHIYIYIYIYILYIYIYILYMHTNIHIYTYISTFPLIFNTYMYMPPHTHTHYTYIYIYKYLEKNMACSWINSILKSNDSLEDLNKSTIK